MKREIKRMIIFDKVLEQQMCNFAYVAYLGFVQMSRVPFGEEIIPLPEPEASDYQNRNMGWSQLEASLTDSNITNKSNKHQD